MDRNLPSRLKAFTIPALVLGSLWLIIQIIDRSDWNAGVIRAQSSLVLLLTSIIALLNVKSRNRRTDLNSTFHRFPKIGLFFARFLASGLLLWQIILAIQGSRSPALIDIATTSVSAGQAISQGNNPYTTPIDPKGETLGSGMNFNGFKYLPWMAIIYLPAAGIGARGVPLINFFLQFVTASMVFLIARALTGQVAGWVALVFYLSIPLVPRELFGPGSTDLAAVLPLMLSFGFAEKKKFLSGLFMGISLSTKLLPAALVAPLLGVSLTAKQSLRGFLSGLTIGMLPLFYFLFVSPTDLFTNAVLFSLFRPVDSTSWLAVLPQEMRFYATSTLLLLWLGASFCVWRYRPERLKQAWIWLILILAATLLGPTNHRNYQLWIIPWVSILWSGALFQNWRQGAKASA